LARTINVVWHAQEYGRGRFNCTAMLNDMLDLYPCEHHGGASKMPTGLDGAVVVVHGGREIGGLAKLQNDIKSLKWCLLIYLGDEEASFPSEMIEHENMLAWVQEPLPGKHDFAKRFMVNGYGHDHLRHLENSVYNVQRDLDWFFGGQVTHERRRAVVDALRTLDWGGFIIETRGYHQGISLPEYYRCLCRAKIVPCPSGLFSPDAARAWDALECGAIPILDNFSPTRSEPGFWDYVLGPGHPLPTISDWKFLPAMVGFLKDTKLRAVECLAWWQEYKRDFNLWLGEDIEQLTGELCTRI